MIPTKKLYEQYISAMHKIADLKYASALLQWDQETYLPPKGAAFRGQQIATLSELAHQLFTDDSLYALLLELRDRDDLSFSQKKNTVLTIEDIDRQKKLSPAFVRQLSEVTQESFHSWLQARKANDFFIFEPSLTRLFELKKHEGELIGFKGHAYDAFLNDHDKGLTSHLLDSVFASLAPRLKELLAQVQSQPTIDDHFLYRHYPKNLQWDFSMEILKALGYDFEAGRQDLSEHPFTVNFNSRDVRITTRIDENNPAGMIWSCIHELGHALYEQGLPSEQYGLPLSEAASFSIHESQSRLWENHVGRSLAFCEYIFPMFKKYFPEQVKDVSHTEFFKAINKVQPSLIRTEADELTYHFHVMIRYQIEKMLFDGSLMVKDIPHYWNELYKDYLGLDVPDHKQGCLQDVHWSHGSFGYFPTYSLGSLYAAQFFSQTSKSVGDLDKHIRNGQFGALLQWLTNEVYVHGRLYTSEELCKKICAKGLDTSHFIDYLLAKYKMIYEF